jgi:hypothetical protein
MEHSCSVLLNSKSLCINLYFEGIRGDAEFSNRPAFYISFINKNMRVHNLFVVTEQVKPGSEEKQLI